MTLLGKMIMLIWVIALLLSYRADSMTLEGKKNVKAFFTGDIVEKDSTWSNESIKTEEGFHKARPQCCDNPPPRDHLPVGVGHTEKIGGLNAYFTGSPHAKATVLLVSDIYGYEAPNFRKLADKVAATGYFVVVPDYFYGDPYVADKDFNVWLKKHEPEKGFKDSRKIIKNLKSRGITCIGAAGFCWGGKVVVKLDKAKDIKAAVLLHPAYVTVDDIKGVKVPIEILAAELDTISPPKLIKKFEAVLSENPEVDSFVKIYPGVAHGWTVRYDVKNETAVKKAEAAHSKMLKWFNKYLK